jgi:hypothetical protein
MPNLVSRPLHAHAYAAADARLGAQIAAPVGLVKRHPASPQTGGESFTPISAPHAPAWTADGAPFYNSGYVYPQHGPLATGGSVGLNLPPLAGMIDLTDMTTWDRPVWFGPGVS